MLHHLPDQRLYFIAAAQVGLVELSGHLRQKPLPRQVAVASGRPPRAPAAACVRGRGLLGRCRIGAGTADVFQDDQSPTHHSPSVITAIAAHLNNVPCSNPWRPLQGIPGDRTAGGRLSLEMRVEPSYRLAPGIPGRFRTVAVPSIAVEAVSAPRIHVEFVLLAILG